MKRTANARWNGSIKEGNGTFGVASGAIAAPGTNPEELIAAAHAAAAKAGCPISKVLGLEITLTVAHA